MIYFTQSILNLIKFMFTITRIPAVEKEVFLRLYLLEKNWDTLIMLNTPTTGDTLFYG